MRLSAVTLASSLLLGACGNAPPPPAEEAPRPAPAPAAWSSPESPEWEVATKKVKGSKDAECEAVHAAMQREQACKGSLCSHAVALASEWVKHCNEGPPRGDDEALVTELGARAKKAPSECGARAEAILSKGCERDATCEVTASKWAAHCGKSDGSPLVLGLLGRAVAKKSALADFKLDTRTCDELRADVKHGVACERAACPAAFKDAQAYRSRCEASGPPDAAWAMVETAIFAAAGQPTVPALVKPDPPKLTPEDMPVPLADRWGAVASVCDERPADVGRYVAARRACEKGKIVFVRVFVSPSKDYDVRAGSLPAPDDETFARRFPSLRVVGELEARDEAARQALLVELPKVVALAKDPSKAAEAARALVRVVAEHGASIARSPAVRAAFVGIDGDLAPALAEIGRAKLEAARSGKLAAADLAGLAARAPTRPFADLGEGGAVVIGALGAASRVEGAEFIPRAMKAYTTALGKDLAALAKKKPLSPKDVREAKARASEASKSCATAASRARSAERDLVACAFTMNTCAPDKVEALTRALDEDRAAMVAARHTIDLAESVLPASARSGGEVCKEP